MDLDIKVGSLKTYSNDLARVSIHMREDEAGNRTFALEPRWSSTVRSGSDDRRQEVLHRDPEGSVKKNQQLAQLLLEIQMGPGQRVQRLLQASSVKLQAPSSESHKQQASSVKHKGSSAKPQASSSLIMEPGKSFTDL